MSEGRVIKDTVSLASCVQEANDTDHGEDWAAAAVELASQCDEWSKGQI